MVNLNPKLDDKLHELPRALISSDSTAFYKYFLLPVFPAVFLMIGILTFSGFFGVPLEPRLVGGLFLVVGLAVGAFSIPLALQLKTVECDSKSLTVRQFRKPSARTVSLDLMCSVEPCYCTPPVVTIRLVDGSAIRFIPRREGWYWWPNPANVVKLQEISASNQRQRSS